MKWYDKYARNQRTLDDIAEELKITKQKLQRKFDALCVVSGELHISLKNEPIAVVMDATHISNVGMLTVVRNLNKENLYWFWSETEKVAHYELCLNSLEYLGYSFSSFVIDNKPGVRQMLAKKYPNLPIQACQKHQIDIAKRYIPRKTQTRAGKFLRNISMRIVKQNLIQTSIALDIWHILYKDFLNEKTYNSNLNSSRKWWYTHKNIRSSFNSLRKNLPFLYVYQEYPDHCIPNTTNICDGYFSHFKERLNRHRGLSSERKKKMANYLLENY